MNADAVVILHRFVVVFDPHQWDASAEGIP